MDYITSFNYLKLSDPNFFEPSKENLLTLDSILIYLFNGISTLYGLFNA